MFCAQCGKRIGDDAKFCVHCGANLRPYALETACEDSSAEAPSVPDLSNEETGELTTQPEEASTICGERVRQGKVLAGKYRIVDAQPLGRGGMGEVWRAEDLHLGMIVAVKLVPPVLLFSRHAVRSLKREALIGCHLAHPNICRLYGFYAEGDVQFVVMEYVPGRTLSSILKSRKDPRMTWEELAPYARQVADALDYAHAVTYTDPSGRPVKGVLHRDVKPQNIMSREDGLTKLMDFGIAREIHDTLTQLTGQRSLTLGYASPEQFRGETMRAASDIYSFATVLYRGLAGRPLVDPEGDVSWQILEKPWEDIPGQPPAVNAALRAGLAKDPRHRPASARQFTEMFTAAPPAPEMAEADPAAPPEEHPRRLTLRLPGGPMLKLILVPAGTFQMGSPAAEKPRRANEGPPHGVTISNAFYMGLAPITQAQWTPVMRSLPWRSDEAAAEGDDLPAVCLDWRQAVEFCRKLSQSTGWPVRLPTEAEWEYACRAGSAARFCFGDDEALLADYAWYGGPAGAAGVSGPQPVARKRPNDWGLYDMHGNVQEWCSDWFSGRYYAESPPVDPPGPTSGIARVVRGGSHASPADECRSAHRGLEPPGRQWREVGFRIVMDFV